MGIKAVPVEEYVDQLLVGRSSITSDEIPLDNDFDYVMSVMIAAEYDCKSSSYRLEFLDGRVSRNGYAIPNMRVIKKSF